MSGFCSLHIALSTANFFFGATYSGIGAGKFGGEFRNLEDGEGLSFFDVRTDVDVHGFDVAGNLGVEVDFLKGHKASRQRERGAQGTVADLDDSRNRRAVVLGIVGAIGFGLRVAEERPKKEHSRDGDSCEHQIFFVCHTFSCPGSGITNCPAGLCLMG
jgi:hypothetical protein